MCVTTARGDRLTAPSAVRRWHAWRTILARVAPPVPVGGLRTPALVLDRPGHRLLLLLWQEGLAVGRDLVLATGRAGQGLERGRVQLALLGAVAG